MSNKRKRNIIIGILCTVLLLMVVGYAAFSSILNITGTSKISSNWNVLITDVTEGTITGTAKTTLKENGEKQISFDDLTANFSADLVSPGDAIEYKIKVENRGTLNAKLDKITVSESDNEYVTFETSGLTEGDQLNAGSNAVLTVKVIFKDIEISKSEPSTSSLSITLDYSQADGSGAVVPDNFTGIVYSYNLLTYTTDEEFNAAVINIGDSLEKIKGYTEDYNSLNNGFFLKHNMLNGQVESSELCFIKEGIHCLKHNEFETTKANLLSIFGQSGCTTSANNVRCQTDSFEVRGVSGGAVGASNELAYCGVNDKSIGDAMCALYE